MRIFVAVILLGLAYLLFWPVPVEPVAVEMPEDAGFTGDFVENTALDAAQLIRLPGEEIGPEDIAVMPDGTVYTTSLSGTLYRIDGADPVAVDQLGGRPLGLKAGPDGALYIADSYRGVMRWTGPGTLDRVVSDINGAPVNSEYTATGSNARFNRHGPICMLP